ncbi:MAG: SWIM zinc finger family protein [Chloroflexota bacterium]
MISPKNIKELQDASRDLTVHFVNRLTYRVESRSNPENPYIVRVNFDDGRTVQAICTCPWATFNGIGCAHVMATLEHLASQKDRTLSFWNDETDARRQKHRLFKLIGNQDSKDQSNVWITSRGIS